MLLCRLVEMCIFINFISLREFYDLQLVSNLLDFYSRCMNIHSQENKS